MDTLRTEPASDRIAFRVHASNNGVLEHGDNFKVSGPTTWRVLAKVVQVEDVARFIAMRNRTEEEFVEPPMRNGLPGTGPEVPVSTRRDRWQELKTRGQSSIWVQVVMSRGPSNLRKKAVNRWASLTSVRDDLCFVPGLDSDACMSWPVPDVAQLKEWRDRECGLQLPKRRNVLGGNADNLGNFLGGQVTILHGWYRAFVDFVMLSTLAERPGHSLIGAFCFSERSLP